MAGGISTGLGALNLFGGGGNSLFGGLFGTPTTNSTNIYGQSYADPYTAYGYGGGSSITTGQQSGSGYLSSDQTHQSSQSASANYDGLTENNLFMNQTDQQQVNLFLDPQVGSGRSGTNMPIGSFLSDLVSVSTEGAAAMTEVGNNQAIGLDQAAYAEEGGTAINNSYQVQNNTQIVNVYLDLNLQLPGMPQNPWMPSPWSPGVASYPTNYSSAYGTQPTGYNNYGTQPTTNTNTSYPTPSTTPAPAPQYDPTHVGPYQDFVLTTTDMDYSDRASLRETMKEYSRFFDENGARSLGRAFMTLAGAVGSGENIERAERRFLRFEDAISDLSDEEKVYFHEGLIALSNEVPGLLSDDLFADEIQFILEDLGEVVSGYTYDELGYGDDTGTDGVDVAA